MGFNVDGMGVSEVYEIVSSLMERYVLYKKRWVRSKDPEKIVHPERESPIRTMKSRLDDSCLWLHLRGDYSVCVFAGPKATKFISFDIDIGDPDIVHKIIDTIEELGIPREKIYVSMSGNKGYHVDLYIKGKTYNNLARAFYEEVIARSGLDRKKVEFRPTATQAIKLPLGIHQRTHRRCWYVDRETLEPIERFNFVFETEFIDEEYFNKIAVDISNERLSSIYEEVRKEQDRMRDVHTDIPDDLMICAPGTRHKIQFRVAVMARQRGAGRSGIYTAQMEWYQMQNKNYISSTYDEVCDDANNIADWVYSNVKAMEYDPTAGSKKAKRVKLKSEDLLTVLGMDTKAYRMVALLMLIMCKRNTPLKIAYKTIAERVGYSVCIANRAINSMVEKGCLYRESNNRIVNGVVIKDSNTYILGKRLKIPAAKGDDRLLDKIEIDDQIERETSYTLYVNILARMFSDEYLARFLTKPELADVRRAREGLSDDESGVHAESEAG